MLGQLIGFMVIMAFVVLLTHGCGSIECETKADKMGLPHDYGMVQGCMVKVKGAWVPIESYRVID